MPGNTKLHIISTKSVKRVLIFLLFITAFISEVVYVIKPIEEILQSLKFVQLSYQQRQWLQEGALVKTVDDMLDHELQQTQGTCFVEMPYNELIREGLGSNNTLLGEWAYLLYRTNYNIYPEKVDWGFSKDNKFYRIVFGWGITPKVEQISSNDLFNTYPCIIHITTKGQTVNIILQKKDTHDK